MNSLQTFQIEQLIEYILQRANDFHSCDPQQLENNYRSGNIDNAREQCLGAVYFMKFLGVIEDEMSVMGLVSLIQKEFDDVEAKATNAMLGIV